jgi:hypothetical protein
MISSQEIKEKAEKRYTTYLKQIYQEGTFFPLIIKGDKKPTKDISTFEKEIIDLVNNSKDKKGFGYEIDFKNVNTKFLGEQKLPQQIKFSSENDYLKFIGKVKEVENFKVDCNIIISEFEELKEWVEKHPIQIIQNHGLWSDLLKVCIYFKANPYPKLFVRELPIKVHTKFIEQNKSILKELLDVILSESLVIDEKEFEKRFNLKVQEPLIQIRILDNNISKRYFSGISQLAITVSDFETLDLPVQKIIIVENKTNLHTMLTLPHINKTIAVFGGGYSVNNIKNASWLNKLDIIYWGDIDVQGFEILSQFRGYFPTVKSILMDKETFDNFFENDNGTESKIKCQLNLNKQEQDLYYILKQKNWRLEQEKIPIDYVNNMILK